MVGSFCGRVIPRSFEACLSGRGSACGRGRGAGALPRVITWRLIALRKRLAGEAVSRDRFRGGTVILETIRIRS